MIVAITPGRFHPFHRGHAAAYTQLANMFENCYIGISKKIDPPKSPFSIEERAKMAMICGIPKDKILAVSSPYSPTEYAKLLNLDPTVDVLIFGVSKKDMEGDPDKGLPPDPRFTFDTKANGEPTYMQPYGENIQPMSKHAYIVSLDVEEFTVNGENIMDATVIRRMYITADDNTRLQILHDLYGKYGKLVKSIFDEKLNLTESINQYVSKINKKIMEADSITKEKYLKLLVEAKERLSPNYLDER